MKHIDDWIEEEARGEHEPLIKQWFAEFRKLAVAKDYEWLSKSVITCEYQGKRYRCTGCSRLGDVWLATDMARETGYDLRVDVDQCSAWIAEAKDKEFIIP